MPKSSRLFRVVLWLRNRSIVCEVMRWAIVIIIVTPGRRRRLQVGWTTQLQLPAST